MEKRKWGTFTKIWFGISIVVGVLAVVGGGIAFIGLLSAKGNPNIPVDMYNKLVVVMGFAVVVAALGLAATIWLMKSKSPQALYSVLGISAVSAIVTLLNGQIPQTLGGAAGAVIIWLLCRKVVFDIE